MSSYEVFFKEADKDGSGFLTLQELTEVLRKKGYKDADAKIQVTLLKARLAGSPVRRQRYASSSSGEPCRAETNR
jgi:hypothetical protein